jgi:hypothetical protein
MLRLTSALAGAAVALAMLAGSASAQTIRPIPAAMTGDHAGAIQLIDEDRWAPRRYWRHSRHWRRDRWHDDDDFNFGSFGFGFALGSGFGRPYGYGYPYSYAYRPARPACPYGTVYSYDYGCVDANYGYEGYARDDYDYRGSRSNRYDYYPLNRGD